MLDDESIVMIVRMTLLLVLKIAGPILIAGMAIGLLISLFQSVTSIQDQTLTFVPKIAIMVIVAAMMLPWIVGKLMTYTIEMMSLIGY